MIAFEVLLPNLVRAHVRWHNAPLLKAHYQSLNLAYDSNNDELIIDTSKSFLECVCKTAIRELSPEQPSSTATPTEIMNDLLKLCGVENTRTRTKANKLLSLHNQIADLVGEMRNEAGSISHGKEGFYESISRNQTQAFLIAIDSLIGFVLGAIEGTVPNLKYTREPWDRFPHINKAIDGSTRAQSAISDDGNTVEVTLSIANGDDITIFVETSKILYLIDREAYIEAYNASKSHVHLHLENKDDD